MGSHGYSKAKILKQNGKNVILDISSWVDEKGMGEWKSGMKIKKAFPLHVLFLVGLRWNKDLMCNECRDLVIGQGYQKSNRYYVSLLSKTIFFMKDINICFPTKFKKKKLKNSVYELVTEEYSEFELINIIEELKSQI